MAELVSIIIPAYNAQSFIYRAVMSVIGQRYPDWEILLVADDNYDYQALLKSKGVYDPRIRYFSTSRVKSGPNRARNIGMSAALGPWIAPLDADDVYYPDRLGTLLAAAQDTGLSIDNGYVVDDAEENARAVFYEDKEIDGLFGFDDYKRSRAPLLFLFHRCLIVHGWDADIECGADTLFNLRALEAAQYARFVSRPLHEYRVHNESICHRPGAAKCFDKAYQYTIERLKNDGLGFKNPVFKNSVIQYIEEKLDINHRFESALAQGYAGNYQQFVAESGLGDISH